MATDYDLIAAEYKRAKQQPWRMHVEYHTLFGLLGDLSGKSVLDLACGEGFYTRFLRRAGAGRTVGVDLSRGMIDLALEEERRQPLGIEYLQRDAASLDLGAGFDLVVAAYLLNYAPDYDALLGMCRAAARHLPPGARFVTVNNHPAHPRERFGNSRKYGFTKRADAPLAEGVPVAYVVHLDDGQSVEITNYHLAIATHERALREAGFREVAWHGPTLAPGAGDGHPPGYWDEFLQFPPVVFLECTR
jgi:ubiquinone/menaquinone biosynthesis C-methylase UbiE